MTHCHYSDLDDDSVLVLRGAAIAEFLQGQLTCDTRQLAATRSVPGALCNVQGRVIADLRVLLPEPALGLLRLGGDLQEHTAAVLRKYAMFSRIDVAAADGEWRLGGLWGPGARAALEQTCGSAPPATAGDVLAGEDWLMVCSDDDGTAFECYFRGARGDSLRDALRGAATAGNDWRARELRRGLVRLGGGQTEKHLPQALNYDLAGLVSFRKGCYTGQEVIARLHYRGKAKKRACLYHAPPGVPVAAGETLRGDDGAALGAVLRCAGEADGGTLLAALLRPQDHGLPAHSAAGDPLAPQPWPYDAAGV